MIKENGELNQYLPATNRLVLCSTHSQPHHKCRWKLLVQAAQSSNQLSWRRKSRSLLEEKACLEVGMQKAALWLSMEDETKEPDKSMRGVANG